MNKMRLTRDRKWFFQYFPYHQLHMDNELFKGWVSLNYLTDGETRYWEYEKSGKIPVSAKGMTWLTLIPDDRKRCIGAYIKPDRRVSVWYVDVIEETGMDEDGIVYYIDKYLDVILTPQGDVIVQDRDELDAAYHCGELSNLQYEAALKEGELIISEMAADIGKTEEFCLAVLARAEEMLAGDKFTIFLDIDGVLDVYNSSIVKQELLPQAVADLKGLIERTQAEVVVISDWRYGAEIHREKAENFGLERNIINWDNLVEVFAKEGISIKDVTPWEERFPNRTAEIKRYLELHPEIKRYVILDDCFSDNYEGDKKIQKHLVVVDALKGLQKENLLAACAVMNMQE